MKLPNWMKRLVSRRANPLTATPPAAPASLRPRAEHTTPYRAASPAPLRGAAPSAPRRAAHDDSTSPADPLSIANPLHPIHSIGAVPISPPCAARAAPDTGSSWSDSCSASDYSSSSSDSGSSSSSSD